MTEWELKQKIARCLEIDERYIKVAIDPDNGRYLATISRDLDRDLSYLDIPKFDKSIFALECDLEFIKCRFHCKVCNCDSSGELRDIHIGLDFSDCIFAERVDFLHSTFEQKVIFLNSKFQGEANFVSLTFTQGVNFSHSTFEQKARFAYSTFEQEADFYNSTFKQEANFVFLTFEQKADFDDSTFEKETHFYNSTFKQEANFSKSAFEQLANFSNSKFQGQANFSGSTFRQEANFSNSKFQGKANFSHTLFKHHSSFWHCHFEKTANFYSAIFRGVPNFSQALFKDNLNAVNIQTDFGFEEIKEVIEQTKKEFDQHNLENKDKKPLVKFANDFRDSFRILKNTLIKENNLLDASNYHKMELYAKELELNYRLLEKKNLKDQDANKAILNQIAPEQESTGKTETNQTAPEQNQNAKDKDLKTTLKQENTKEMSNQESQHKINFFQLLAWLCDAEKRQNTIDLVQLIFYRYTSDHHTDLLKSFHSLLAVMGIFGLLSLGISLFCLLAGYDKSSFSPIELMEFYDSDIQSFLSMHCVWAIFVNLILIILMFFGLAVSLLKFLRPIFVGLGYLSFLAFLIISPKFLLPAIGIFNNRSLLDPWVSVGGVYAILFALLFYSLIKTARKNSILPS